MALIAVYRTVDPASLYENQEAIARALGVPEIFTGGNGNIQFAQDASAARGDVTIDNGQDACKQILAYFKAANAAMASDTALKVAGIPPLFPGSLGLEQVAETIPGEQWSAEFSIKLKPSRREQAVEVEGASIKATVNSDGVVSYVYLNWRPVLSQKSITKKPLFFHSSQWRKSQIEEQLEVIYRSGSVLDYVVPYYRLQQDTSAFLVPATCYFLNG